MTFDPQLFRRGGQQEYRRGQPAQPFDQLVVVPGAVRAPAQMMRLIDYQNIPSGLCRLVRPFRILHQVIQAGHDKLFGVEGVVAGRAVLNRQAAVFIEDIEFHVEPAQHLDKPLVDQGLGQQHQNSLDPSGHHQPVQDQSGLDGFAQAHLVGQQDPRRGHRGGGAGDIELVAEQIDAGAGESAGCVSAQVMPERLGLAAQDEKAVFVALAMAEPVVGLAEADQVAELGFGKFPFAAMINQQPFFLPGLVHGQFRALLVDNAVSGLEGDPVQGGLVGGVAAFLLAGRENDPDHPGID